LAIYPVGVHDIVNMIKEDLDVAEELVEVELGAMRWLILRKWGMKLTPTTNIRMNQLLQFQVS